MRPKTFIAGITSSLLLQPLGATAQRACGNATFPWTISEWTYDGPERGRSGRVGTDSVVGLLLSNGGTTYSCIGTWPEDWEGWDERGSALIWHLCLNNFGRSVDETLSFAVDWKNRTLHVSHTFKCLEDTGKSQLATGSIPLETTCDVPTGSSEKPSRCLTTARRFDITTQPGPTFSVTTNCNHNEGYLPWQVTNWTQLYQASPMYPGHLFNARHTATNEVFKCTSISPSSVTDANYLFIEGNCTSTTAPSSNSTKGSTTFRFELDRKLLTIAQWGICPGHFHMKYTVVGNAEVPPLCWENDVPTCEAESAFWIGAAIVPNE
ncbi:hypothetical protein QBC35DRAFT_544255 [Podospora australis]|uniref:AA1-like domain-containing protein n=1 Tax=Podospora australis TaxID=1536484 RepID=A0AAN6WN84_9PEZI|nr:hypothetical protein QBC35DRAFT_544255 [Podospora australis]